jgi:hypothetical protein
MGGILLKSQGLKKNSGEAGENQSWQAPVVRRRKSIGWISEVKGNERTVQTNTDASERACSIPTLVLPQPLKVNPLEELNDRPVS